MGGNCWSRDLKVRQLLKPARLDRRLSLTPPISLDSISSADMHQAISLNAHCLSSPNHLMLDLICLARETGSRALSIDGNQLNKPYGKSADGWVAWPPARLFHGVPRLDGVVPQHSSSGHRLWRTRRNVPIGPDGYPLSVSGCCIRLEMTKLLLLL